MKGDKIKYKAGYKYQLHESFSVWTKITAGINVKSDFIRLDCNGLLTILAGYAWNGCSGPTIDDKTNMRAGCVHDALYQLMEDGDLDLNVWRDDADRLFYDILREDGMLILRAKYYYFAVRQFGKGSATPKPEKVLIAP
jgi:hypothetical protein